MRLILTLTTILGVLALIASGLYYGYGFGVKIFQEKIAEAQENFDQNAPIGTHAELTNIYYAKNFQSLVVEYHFGDDLGVFDEVMYAKITIPDMTVDEDAYDENSFPEEDYELIPEMILTDDGDVVMTKAITYAIISVIVFVGSIVVKALFFKKR